MPGGYLLLNSPHILSTVNWTDIVPTNHNCSTGIQWVWAFMGQCVVDARGTAAVACGFICLVVWILNGIPQMIENCRVGLADQAISPFLLLFWTLGDTTNLIGCILTHQLVLQAVISVYSIVSDLLLVTQFMYYKLKHKVLLTRINQQLFASPITLPEDEYDSAPADEIVPVGNQCLLEPHESTNSDDSERTRLMSFLPIIGFSFLLTVYQSVTCHRMTASSLIINRDQATLRSYQFSARHLFTWTKATTTTNTPSDIMYALSDYTNILPSTSSKIGYALGFLSSIMYGSSRLPQIFRNWRRKSTEGLCLWLFFMAVLGNTSYALQIFLTSLEPIYLLQALPWLIGSLGVIALDFIICIQFYLYKPVRPKHRDFSLLLPSSDSDQSTIDTNHHDTV